MSVLDWYVQAALVAVLLAFAFFVVCGGVALVLNGVANFYYQKWLSQDDDEDPSK